MPSTSERGMRGDRLPPLTLRGWLRYDVVVRLLAELPGIESVLEVGAGGGALGARLASCYAYVGLEPDRTSFRAAAGRIEPRGGTVVNGELDALDPARRFDLVCAFEVLEHLEDDAAALRAWRERLHPRGWLLVSVPAWQRRFGEADRRAGHFRRYDRERLAQLVADAGFAELEIRTYGFPMGYLLQRASNALARRTPDMRPVAERTAASGRWLQPPQRLGWATRAASAPFRRLQRPFAATDLGTGFVLRARRT